MLGDLMTSVQPIEVKVFGNDQATLQSLSKKIAGLIEKVEGTADVFDGIVIAGPSINIEPNYAAMAQYGITASNLQFQMQSSLEGNLVGTVYDKEQLSNLRLIYPGSKTLSVADIEKTPIFYPMENCIPSINLQAYTLIVVMQKFKEKTFNRWA